ncbi:protein-O-mannosyltransferase-like protein [Frondihabitans sp. PhB188]|uniref:dolichyl-phosphate-mannose--protein mannosyltransferase n=1 Tax=Frondihabitans sp. PhB188 TaxID=2485200 RepID=UPI000F479B20|nr:phospholipid carrier-dependent glycosyltransferase [Frondihabitans sp. PhB188]ROQ38595.1 protein-O-mannosyltransferase-like protein [Frondihabitans sp. PhB188]
MTDRPVNDFDELVGHATAPVEAPARAPQHSPVRVARLAPLDAWWGRVLATPARQRAWRWGGPFLVTLVAAFLRLWHLGHPDSLVFDETYYVKDAWTLHNLGYEASWPGDVDAKFAAGQTDVFLRSAEFIAHPPLGKWIISLGMAVTGPDNPAGWRLSTAVVGIIAVLLVTLITTHLLKSTVLGVLAGFFMAIDGQAIVLSRVSLLDNFVMFFALLAFGAILLDRHRTQRRLDAWVAKRDSQGRDLAWGPALWNRPWLVVAGLMLGAATGVKWNGAFFLAIFAVYTIAVDMAARRRIGVEFWGTGTIFRQGPVSFLLMVPIAAATYIASWTGWFATKGGYYRTWVEDGGDRWKGALAWVPDVVQNFWHYQAGIYAFNVGLSTPHPYQANPLLWLLMQRPTSMYYLGLSAGQDGCASDRCGQAITGIANPLIWYAAVAACLYLCYRLVRYREWHVGAILIGAGAGFLPWLMYLDRTVFQFYTIAFEPYLIMGLAAALGVILGRRTDDIDRRLSGIRVVGIVVILSIVLSVFYYPMWTAIQENWSFISLHYWIPSWK